MYGQRLLRESVAGTQTRLHLLLKMSTQQSVPMTRSLKTPPVKVLAIIKTKLLRWRAKCMQTLAKLAQVEADADAICSDREQR